jgi:23S rRNA-/tRNA-specific pseudouridylate synthase
VDLPIGKNPEAGAEGPRMMIDKENGRSSLTKFSVVARLETPFKRTLVQLEPVTGRTHQLRLHMKAMGYDLVSFVITSVFCLFIDVS